MIGNALRYGCALLCAGGSMAVSAGEFNHRNLLVGDRAIGLGGAYTALSDDPSGMFYNPAGIVHATRAGSTSLNAMSYAVTRYEDVLPRSENLSRDSLVVIPGFFGVSARLGSGQVGFFMATTDYSAERKSDRFSLAGITGLSDGGGTFSNDVDSSRYQIGVAWGQPLSQTWSVGSSLSLQRRDNRELRRLDATAIGAGSGNRLSTLTGIRVSDIDNALLPVLGLHYRGPGRLSAGLTLSRPFSISREYEYDYRRVDQVTAPDGSPVSAEDEQVTVISDASQRYPWHLGLGVAARVSGSLLLSVNVDHYGKVDAQPRIVDPAAPPVTRAYQATTNLAVGAEWQAGEQITVRSALFTDRANTRLAGAQAFERREQINLLGLSASVSFKLAERVLELGAYGSWGRGHAALGDLAEVDFTPSATVEAHKRQFVLFFGFEL